MFILKNTPLAYFPTIILGLISVFHAALVALLSLSLGTGSRGLIPAILLVIGAIVLLAVGCYLLHRIRCPEKNKLRNILTFGLLFPVTLVHLVLLLIRTRERGLHADLATLTNPHQVAVALVVLSCGANLFAFVGLCLSPFSRDAESSTIDKDNISSSENIGPHGITIHYSEKLVTVPVKLAAHHWDPTKTPSSCPTSTRTMNVTTHTVRRYGNFDTTYITWTDVPL